MSINIGQLHLRARDFLGLSIISSRCHWIFEIKVNMKRTKIRAVALTVPLPSGHIRSSNCRPGETIARTRCPRKLKYLKLDACVASPNQHPEHHFLHNHHDYDHYNHDHPNDHHDHPNDHLHHHHQQLYQGDDQLPMDDFSLTDCFKSLSNNCGSKLQVKYLIKLDQNAKINIW